ncbi:hypothetical protein VNO78_34988 [Psophocarpus tetragonolobus]|uniref:Uncharacterized protein n=1 Tax=Psophocarpus tetragonolobus TaxID=3891 RepID=A0AAN9NT70_PSOTE
MMKLSILNVCLSVVLFYPFVVTAISEAKYKDYGFPAVFAFGDSILDTGNNNYIFTILKSNFKPYGRDFIGGNSTGRFCNGRIPSDFLVENLGIKESMPPYLDPSLEIEDLLTGVCFASAGSGFDPLTIKIARVLSIEDQLNMFKEYVGRLHEIVGEEKTAFILEKSIVFISMGSNDISGTYFMTPFRRRTYNIEEYTTMLVNTSSNFLLELYSIGVRRIGVLSLSPVGCVPLQRTLRGGLKRDCSESTNQGCMLYNSKLSSSLISLSKILPEAKLVFLENYSQFNKLVQHPSQYGFEVVDRTCCGILNIEFGLLCNTLTPKVCEDASKYVFWDGYHPTERAYKIIVSEILKKYLDQFV